MQPVIGFRDYDPEHDAVIEGWDHEDTLAPSVFDEAVRLVQHFFNLVKTMPQEFVGRLLEAVKALERALNRIGARFEELGLTRRKVFKEAYGLVKEA